MKKTAGETAERLAECPCSLVICTISPTVLVGICTKTLNMY